MRIILTTGMSGSGKSAALDVPGDAGYYCVDSLPAQFIPELARYLTDQSYMYLGVATDIRSRGSLRKVPETVTMLYKEHDVRMLFLTTSTIVLVQRYSETRRRHPLSVRSGCSDIAASVQAAAKGLDTLFIEAIKMECGLLSPLAGPAHRIDTSTLRASALRAYVRGLISDGPHDITLMFESFGFKHGMPIDADLAFDARSLSNPCYDTQLCPLTGCGQPVIDLPQSQSMVLAMAEDIRAYVEKWLPSFIVDDCNYLTVAIGCTGGQHCSVCIAERLVMYLRAHGNVLVHHHELAVDD